MTTNFAAARNLTFALLGAVALGAGCESKGPAERAGEKVDQGVQDVKDAVSPPGPVEKAGREADKALKP